jgi:hypothetical protein
MLISQAAETLFVTDDPSPVLRAAMAGFAGLLEGLTEHWQQTPRTHTRADHPARHHRLARHLQRRPTGRPVDPDRPRSVRAARRSPRLASVQFTGDPAPAALHG